MLADLLEQRSADVLSRVKQRTPSASDRERASALLRDLIRRVEPAAVAMGLDVQAFLRTVRILKACVFETVEEHGGAVAGRELWLAADWFGALAERALGEDNARLTAMIDALPDLLHLQDLDVRILLMNRASLAAAQEITGESSIVGRTVGELPMEEPFRKYILGVSQRANNGETVREEYLQPGPDGGRWREHWLAPVVGKSGTVEAVAVANRDIHARKIAEQALAEALAFRERVMGILGHDLRNPLGSVLALSHLLERQDDVSEKAKRRVQGIRQAAERMNEMIATLLDFTQLRFRGPPPLALEPMNLGALAQTIVDELRVTHQARAIEIDARGDLHGRWDRGRIGQVISNLVGNAITHGAAESPIQLTLSGDDGWVTLAVSNRGPTIPPADLDHLFEPFWQARGSGEQAARGLGLGLYIVQQLVLAHRGSIDVRSADETATFTVRLPREAA
jgi:PAS domain S-box-containing protein